jgi:protein-tyrosine-phosphatase
MAERLGRAYLDDVLGDAATEIRLVSAGTRAVVGSAMHPHTALVLADFRAQQLTEAMPATADLILTMTRSHRRDVLAAAPRGLARTFTLLEAAALLGLLTNDAGFVGSTFPDRVRSLVAALAAARSRRSVSGDDDVPDPIGHPVEVHEEVGEAIASAVLALLRRIADLR